MKLTPEEAKTRRKQSALKYRASHLELCKERERKYAALHKKERAAAAVRRRKANPGNDKIIAERNRFVFPLTKARHQARKDGHSQCLATPYELQTAFTGKCHVCDCLEGKMRFHMDHSHSTGKFRGWLCQKCNWALGQTRDSPSLLRALADYLEKQS